MHWFSDFPTSIEMADDTTALLIYWRMWWCGPLPRVPCPHAFVDFLRSDSANRHILGCGEPRGGAYDPKFELRRDFCTVHLMAKFHHPTFNCSEVIVLTNRRRWKHPPRAAMICRWIALAGCCSLSLMSDTTTCLAYMTLTLSHKQCLSFVGTIHTISYSSSR